MVFVSDPADPHYGSVEVRGLAKQQASRLGREAGSAEGPAALEVFTGASLPANNLPAADFPGIKDALPPVLGDITADGDRLRFTPRYPFVPGQPYTARWRGLTSRGEAISRPANSIHLSFSLPASPVEATTRVTEIYPTASELPENLLKFYLHFSAPMSRGRASEHLRLLDATGRELPYPFVAPHQELWNRTQDRLTLILDPGRIKRNVGPNLEMGPPLLAGGTFRLVIDQAWLDGQGQPMVQGFEKDFSVTAADHLLPSIDDWHLEPPQSPMAPLILHFPEPFDHALLHRLLRVFPSGDSAVPDQVEGQVEGTILVGKEERVWSFTPTQPWTPGSYQLRAASGLEDLAGNTFHRAFDEALASSSAPGHSSSSESSPGVETRSFTVSYQQP